jgi:hypothetical protein
VAAALFGVSMFLMRRSRKRALSLEVNPADSPHLNTHTN